MHNYKRLPISSLGRKVLGVAVASSLLLLSNANATGLGKLTVLSALGQPLRAEIELTSPDKDEIASLVPKLATAEAFRQSNIDFNPALFSLRFVVESRGAGYVIRVTSTQAMNEPFVDLLLEMNSNNGKLLREYTFLLDPAELRNSQSAQVANPVNIAIPNSSSSSSTVSAPAKQLVSPSPNSNLASPAPLPQKRVTVKTPEINKNIKISGDYQVKRGDTLSKIAGEYKSDGVSLDQMLVSMYKANPQAFSGSNMNRLKSGQILSIPDADTSRASAGIEPHAIVLAHATDFASYRNKLAGQVVDAPAQKTVVNKQTVSGSITAKVKEVPTATNEALDKLKLSKATPNASAKSVAGNVLVEEDRLAKDKAVADANARVKELEKNVGDLQKILEVKNKDLAEKQFAASTKLASSSASISASAIPASVASATVQSTSASAAPASTAVVVSAPAKRKVAPPPVPESNWYDGLSDFLWPGTLVLALLGGYGLFSSRRKKKTQQFDDSVLTGSSMKANSMFGSTGGQSVDTNNSVFNSNFAPSASQLDANEVDPVAEADVYIAYGRDSQAEEILKEALRTQPDRHAVRVKLLEIYFNRKDPRSFERLASELYGMTSGEGEEWEQAASMGVTLEPTNPLYAGGKAQVDTLSATSGLGLSTQPLEDLEPEALLGNSLSQDMLDSISIIDTASGLTEDALPSDPDVVSVKDSDVGSMMDIGALDFDLDIPNPAAFNEPVVPMLPDETDKAVSLSIQQMPEENPVVDFGMIDFDLGSSEEVSATPDDHLRDDKSNLELIVEPSIGATVEDLNHIAFETASIPDVLATPDLYIADVDAKESAAEVDDVLPVVPSAFEFDLSGINLDLGSLELKDDIAAMVNEDASHYNAEMATKLDLAVAYQEIGDKEGARELLDEVLKGGTQDQIEKAQNMLAQLL
ncbi:MAG: FimV/HubP family polar landmark protein [Undibacterium sp.]|uniref:FimV/HubP family polar landmark protein n=1 Tax=Undibacterium sp. TaxID=1914977 RepID=UPI002724A3B6|nr:FimV/HubP family polar landmark protein [Undibacterium sp.]MDO8653883.1 FimV/HubP family polar landmark protein [Undibacterium sp.]